MIKSLAFVAILVFTCASRAEQIGIRNFKKVSNAVYRGGKPQDMNDVRALRNMGIKTIINLQGGDGFLDLLPGEREPARLEEGGWAQAVGLRYLNVPVPAMRSPTGEESEQIRRLVAKMRDPRFQPVFVHCNFGDDRTGLIIALYRVFGQRWAPEQAYQEMVSQGHSGIQGIFTTSLDSFFRDAVSTPGWLSPLVAK